MRILILSIYHDPEPIPKTGELARELQRRGHEVTVVTAFPHYPSGNLYPGYRLRPWMWETREGVRVLRTFIYPYHGTRASLRMVNYGTWMLSAISAAWLTPACDVLYVWHPPLTVGISAWAIGKLKRVPIVYDVQDLWPESALASGLLKRGRLVNFLYRLADWVYARADRLLVVSPATASYLEERGVPGAKMRVARHWIDETLFDVPVSARDVRRELRLEGRFVVMFAGNLGLVQGLETVIDAASLLRDSPVTFVLVGDGADRARLEQQAQRNGLSNVVFAGRHPAAEMPDFFRAADALLVHLRPSGIADHAIPTKILAYLAAARPIVCAMPGAAADLVRDAQAGPVLSPGDAPGLARVIQALARLPAAERQTLGMNGRRYLDEHFRKARVIDEYEGILSEAATLRRKRRGETRAARDRHQPSC
jgi:glycosyltransferase involved in cell wall biosynthesis